jgi:hypothetical protein
MKSQNFKNLSFFFSTMDIESPEIIVSEVPGHPEQAAIMLSVAPSFVEKSPV